ncbi:MAG: SDR family NAD(P)-dependent oxidoreductase [Candidatus Zixiibacteriota bacterium]
MTSLKDKTVLITGASAGIGEAAARAFGRSGSRLILAARREEKLKQLAEELEQTCAATSLILALDLRERDEITEKLGALDSKWRKIDILVNNAGLARGVEKMYEMSAADWNEVVDVNIKGLIAVTNAIVPGMVERGSGHVINLGSIAGHEAYPGGAVYCATKFAVNALSRGLKMDLLGTPVRVTSIDPGLVETEFSQVRFHGDSELARKPYEGIKALSGADIAEAIIWAATRPAHVNISQMIIFPTAQASTQHVHRELE